MCSQTIEWNAGAIVGTAIACAFLTSQVWFIGTYIFALGYAGMLF